MSALSLAIGRILSNKSIREDVSILDSLHNEWMLIDLFVKLSKMYLNWRYDIGKVSLFLKNNSIRLGSLSVFMSDLHDEFKREHILVFFVAFSIEPMFKAEGRILGDFKEEESESGLLGVSFWVVVIVDENCVYSAVCVSILLGVGIVSMGFSSLFESWCWGVWEESRFSKVLFLISVISVYVSGW